MAGRSLFGGPIMRLIEGGGATSVSYHLEGLLQR